MEQETVFNGERKIRVRYAETDTMGILHHSVYPVYFEEGRTELMRTLGLPYSTMEERGVMLPVYSVWVRYFKPACYDELLTLKTTMNRPDGVRIKFDYELRNAEKDLLATGDVVLIFTGKESFKPIRPPEWFTKLILA